MNQSQLLNLDALDLELGGRLIRPQIAYETWGKLNAKKDNAVLVCHALSGDSHAAPHSKSDEPGWWEIMVGPGKPIDTDRFFVICCNTPGGCQGTTGPSSIDTKTGRPFGAEFPDITINDIVDSQLAVVRHLNIDKLHAVIGGSMGGQQSLTWGTRHARHVDRAIVLACGPRLTSQALAFDIVGRNAILRDAHFNAGQFYDQPRGPDTGLAIARMLGHITYLSRDGMTQRFDADRFNPRDIDTQFEKFFSVGSYLAYQGKKFVERFDANSYVTLTRAMDRFDLGATPAMLTSHFENACAKWLVISFSSDWLFPSEQSRELVTAIQHAGKSVSYCDVITQAGHDAFLLDHEIKVFGEMIRAFLRKPPKLRPRADTRADLQRVVDLVPRDASVLDLGCGDGELLDRLRRAHAARKLVGIELDQANVLATIRRGFSCVQADLNRDLSMFTDKQFDFVLLSQTLQSVIETQRVLSEMLRVGRRCVVSFPNFGFKPLREMLYRQGRGPKTPGIYSHDWFNTPNRRFASLLDFREFCTAQHITIERELCLNTKTGKQVKTNPNLNADLGIFVLKTSHK